MDDDDFEIDVSPATGDKKPDLATQLAETNARLDAERELRLKAEGKAEGVAETLAVVGDRSAPPQDEKPEPTYSRAQLKAAVEANQLTEADAELIYENQLRKNITKEVMATVHSATSGQAALQSINAEIDQYTEHFPNAAVAGSKEHIELQSEYKKLRAQGQPKGVATELMAAKIVFGPLSRIKAGKEITRENLDTHQEGSSGNGGRPKSKNDEGTGEGKVVLSSREKTFYQKQIDLGLYKDWKEVGELVKNNANPNIRERSKRLYG